MNGILYYASGSSLLLKTKSLKIDQGLFSVRVLVNDVWNDTMGSIIGTEYEIYWLKELSLSLSTYSNQVLKIRFLGYWTYNSLHFSVSLGIKYNAIFATQLNECEIIKDLISSQLTTGDVLVWKNDNFR